jgi:hypothetical protein
MFDNRVSLTLIKTMQKIILTSMFLFFVYGLKAEGADQALASNIAYLKAKVLSKPVSANDTAWYDFEVKNISSVTQRIHLSIDKNRELACTTILSDSIISLKSGKNYQAKLAIVLSDRIPVGAYEDCKLQANTDEGVALSSLTFITVHAKSHPFLLATKELLTEVQEKIKKYDWAKSNFNSMLEELDQFQFPEQQIITKPRPTKVWSSLNYVASDGEEAFKLAIAYKLSGERKYYNKLVAFIQQLSNKERGYLSVGAATTGVMVHEGNFFLHLAAACDIIYEDLQEEDHENIVAIFRHYLKQNREHMNSLGIMNHQASANAGAILVAIYLQDIAEVNHLTYADGGMADQIGKGVMADGWWFESTVNYCYLVTQRYCLVAQAFENYGWDLYHQRFPVKYKSKDFDNCKEGFTGMKFDNWGPTGRSTRGVEDMVDAYVPFMDENAVVVSSNDSRATAPDPYYELAYREYQQDELAWVLSKTERSSWISLMYGLGELPEVKDPRSQSAFAPNVGITALRSQKEGREPEEQINAYFKYGTHGGWHGQFDRTGMLALNRYGHRFFGTEMAWFGYGHAGYKECVQTSATHNMVIVDEMQQEAVPSEQTLFFAGDLMQVSVTETNARWRKIPSFNIEKFPPWDDKSFDADFKPVLQRRLSIVTDDYVVLADYVKAPEKHIYDWLLHPVGLKMFTGLQKKGSVLDTVNTDPESPYKYFTKGQWYQMKKGAFFQFQDEDIQLDVHAIWPQKAAVLIAHYPVGGKQHEIKNNPNRRTMAVRTEAEQMLYLHVLEPHKGVSMIDKIESKSPDSLSVYLRDGRVQTISIYNLQGDSRAIKVKLSEEINHTVTSEETNL